MTSVHVIILYIYIVYIRHIYTYNIIYVGESIYVRDRYQPYMALPRNYITNPINVTSSTPANNEMYTHDTSTNVKIDVFDTAAIRSEVSSRIIYVYNIRSVVCCTIYFILLYNIYVYIYI